jgi:hypothetical protein
MCRYLVDPLDVVQNGAQHSHGIARGVVYQSQAATSNFLAVDSLDVPIVSPATANQASRNELQSNYIIITCSRRSAARNNFACA